ncbi:hypothetical protein PtA15_1A648 [Puccinia triticina]|uniref:Uncharacterized protein n=1 Tax=Puccinia triticina TaxID=208348 RepID=A0ABY7C808_9BASI|nr:uncharacterized protein PtA15_1A648 [Puccinia triticina]WAQ81308.1 hypothetical protein PtA15_1A648 [Puccinia triticina]
MVKSPSAQLAPASLPGSASIMEGKEDDMPVQEDGIPVQEDDIPVQEDDTPVQEDDTPVQEEDIPVPVESSSPYQPSNPRIQSQVEPSSTSIVITNLKGYNYQTGDF